MIRIDEALGLPLTALPEDWTPTAVAVVVRAVDANGGQRMTALYSRDFMAWEGLAAGAMLTDNAVRAVRETVAFP